MSDPCSVVKTLLEASWILANTDGRRPLIINSRDDTDKNNATRLDTSDGPKIKLYEPTQEQRKPSGVGSQRVASDSYVSIDLYAGDSNLKSERLRLEILRILETHYNNPGTGYDYIDPNIQITPFSGTRGQRLWRWVFDIRLMKTNAALGT